MATTAHAYVWLQVGNGDHFLGGGGGGGGGLTLKELASIFLHPFFRRLGTLAAEIEAPLCFCTLRHGQNFFFLAHSFLGSPPPPQSSRPTQNGVCHEQ